MHFPMHKYQLSIKLEWIKIMMEKLTSFPKRAPSCDEEVLLYRQNMVNAAYFTDNENDLAVKANEQH